MVEQFLDEIRARVTDYIAPAVEQWNTSMEYWWNGSDMGKLNYSVNNLSQFCFVHHKSHMDWPGIEPGPLRWQTGH
jgi:hypothetical protein